MRKTSVPVTITGLTADGFGLTEHNNRPFYVAGAAPGETVQALITKRRRARFTGIVESVTEPSPHRIEPTESHYLSCSPFQCFTTEYQQELKKQMFQESYTGVLEIVDPIVHFPEEITGYRTKIEYSFWYTEDGLQIAFHRRGSPFQKIPIDSGCLLASPRMNELAVLIRDLLRETGIPKKDLLTLTIRESKANGTCLAHLMVSGKDISVPILKSQLPDFCSGWIISAPREHGVSNAKPQVLHQEGDDFLVETILDCTIRYPYNGFFQNHIPLFEKALRAMKSHLSGGKVVDLYCGAGTIGICIGDAAEEMFGVELDEQSVACAMENAKQNSRTNYLAQASASEKMDFSVLKNAKTVILDPPRVGLHDDVVQALIEYVPETIVYLSCNPISQARDLEQLLPNYLLTSLEAYDFYPGALHLESLAILSRKS